MATLAYKARSRGGSVVRGRIDAATTADAVRRLRRNGLQVLQIKEPRSVAQGLRTKRKAGGQRGARVKHKDLLAVLSQLQLMIEAGMGLDDALSLLAENTREPRLGEVLRDVHQRVRRGESLSDALHAHDAVFTPVIVRMVAAGEASGTLATMLRSVREMLVRQHEMRRAIVSALLYPCVLLTVATGAMVVLFVWVLPRFAKVFAEVGAELPAVTRAVLGFSHWVKSWKWALLVMAVAGIVAVRWMLSNGATQRAWTRVLLRLPLVGTVMRASNTARSLQVMATLWRSGLPVMEVTRLTAATVRNPLYRDFFEELRQRLVDGKRIVSSFASTDIFPDAVGPLVRVGDDTGKTPEVLGQLSDYYEKETAALIKSMITLLEPAIIVLMAGGVGLIAVSVVIPLFRLSSAIH